MAFIGGLALVFGFIFCLKLFGVLKKSADVINIAQSAAAIVQDTQRDDAEKERAMRTYAGKLFALFFVIVIGSIAALAISTSIVWLLAFAGVFNFDEVINTTISLKFIAITAALSLLLFLRKRQDKAEGSRIQNNYSNLEKILHYSAFCSAPFLIAASSIERRVFQKKLAGIELTRPVFITALPRAGTTLLLELCVKTNEFASHTYRDMPFLFTPILWERFSRHFKQSERPRERAHGDGMLISPDSPEAFEEMIWKQFWPSRYQANRILPWSESNYPDFEEFFFDHLRKIVLLRKNAEASPLRYLSKNNLNMARIGYLKRIFPDATIIVPFREPLQHASSLLRQHQNFLRIHQDDPFACQYMEAIGHYDFGKNLRPVDFDHWLSSTHASSPNSLAFWLQYWISTYRFLLKNAHYHVIFFSYDAFCKNQQEGLERIGTLLEIKNLESFLTNAERVKPPTPHLIDMAALPEDLLSQAEVVYGKLQRCS